MPRPDDLDLYHDAWKTNPDWRHPMDEPDLYKGWESLDVYYASFLKKGMLAYFMDDTTGYDYHLLHETGNPGPAVIIPAYAEVKIDYHNDYEVVVEYQGRQLCVPMYKNLISKEEIKKRQSVIERPPSDQEIPF